MCSFKKKKFECVTNIVCKNESDNEKGTSCKQGLWCKLPDWLRNTNSPCLLRKATKKIQGGGFSSSDSMPSSDPMTSQGEITQQWFTYIV